jgi:hypothetical protein
MLNTMKIMDSKSLEILINTLFIEERNSINSEYDKLVPKLSLIAYDIAHFIKTNRIINVAKYNKNIKDFEKSFQLTNFHGNGKYSYDIAANNLYLWELASFNNNILIKIYSTRINEDGTWKTQEHRFISYGFYYQKRKIYKHKDEALTHGLKEIENMLQTEKSLYIKHLETLDKKLREKLAYNGQKLSEEETVTIIQTVRDSLVRQINQLITKHSSRYNTTTITNL